jgi:hypothetical protein
MKIRDALMLAQALQALDGNMKIVKDGGQDKAIRVPYEFSGNVRFAIAKNINAIAPVNRTFSDARNALVRQFSGGKEEVPAAAMPGFDAAVAELLDRDEEIETSPLSQLDLNLDKNPIPPSVVAGLMPLLEVPSASA